MGYLRQHQVDEMENERRVIENTLDNRRDIQDRNNMQQTLKRIDRQLEEQAAPQTSSEDRDRMTKECADIEARLVPGMPSDEEMRRNPPGVVGRHMKHEKRAKCKDYFPEGDLNRWKDNQLALNRGEDDPDIANFERMRPLHNHGSMLGAQIPGTEYFGTSPSLAYKEGHDRTFGNQSIAPPGVDDEYVDDPQPQPRQRKKATRKKAGRKRASNKKAPVMTALACGKMMGPSGRHFHVVKCPTCQEAAEG